MSPAEGIARAGGVATAPALALATGAGVGAAPLITGFGGATSAGVASEAAGMPLGGAGVGAACVLNNALTLLGKASRLPSQSPRLTPSGALRS